MKTEGRLYFKAVTIMLKSKEKSKRMKVEFDYKDGVSYLSTTSFSIMEKVSRRTLKK